MLILAENYKDIGQLQAQPAQLFQVAFEMPIYRADDNGIGAAGACKIQVQVDDSASYNWIGNKFMNIF